MRQFDIGEICAAYSVMNKRQRKMIIRQLREKGIDVASIDCFTYADAPGIPQMYVRFGNNKEYLPYFMLPERQLEEIRDVIERQGK